MKLTTLILLTTLIQVSASTVAQQISFRKKNASVQQVFQEIKKQTGYRVLYPTNILNGLKPIDVSFSNASLDEVLQKILPAQQVSYLIKTNKTIILKEPETSLFDDIANFFEATTIGGRVVNDEGKPVAGVNITIKGEKQGVTSNSEGRFSIQIPKAKSILIFSYVGYATTEAMAHDNMIVKLQINENDLKETVVIGYGTSNRKDLTGSVASVNINEVKDIPFATIDQALTGKAAGVQVTQPDGSPGGAAKIRIRGGTSLLGGNDPLYIIDGIQVQIQNRYLQSAADIVNPIERSGNDTNPDNSVAGSFARGLNSLGGLNINDIESIDILKDASAAAIYGSRAANGVIIITTKKGKLNQKPILEANYYAGLTKPIAEKVLNRDEYIMIMKEAAKNLNDVRAAIGLPSNTIANSILNTPDFLGTANTKWMNLVLRNGVTQNTDLSVRGGGTGSRYYSSLSYNKNQGTVLGTDYTRIAGKVSLDNEITKKLRVNSNLDYGFSTNNITNGLYTQALFAPPTFDPYNADGSVKILDPASIGAAAYNGFQNPLFLLSGINKANTVSLIGSLAAEYDILKNLKLRSTLSVNYNNYQQNNYVPSTVSISTSFGTGSSNNGMATRGQSQDVSTFYENNVTWEKQFNENHRLNFLAGTSWQISKSNSFTAKAQGFPDDKFLNNLSSAATTLPSEGVSAQNSLLSFYMRGNYALYEKYLFTFTGRSDASSKFPKKNRVGYFPSGGIAWRLSQENFLKKVKWINDIKLRASIGYTGTQNIADNLFYTLYSPISYAGLNGMSPTQLGNDNIKWENTLQKDLGIDFQFFNSRLRGSIGYYEKSTSGILFPTTVASSSGFKSVTANIADIRNRGLEFDFRGDFIRHKTFQWSGSFNISGNRSKVMALSNDFTDPSNPKVYNYGNTVLKVGEPLGLIYGNVFDGILQTQAEVDAYKARLTYAPTYLGVGDAKYVLETDPSSYLYGFNKSEVIGKAEAKFYGGYTNNITYKNLSMIALINFSYGGEVLYLADVRNIDMSTRANKGISALNRWTPENPSSTRPRLLLGQASGGGMSSSNVYDASFIRLKSVTFNYQFPKKMLHKFNMNNISLYLSASNLFTLTKYPGLDPEVSNNPYSIIGGVSDSGGYPMVKQFSLGIRAGF